MSDKKVVSSSTQKSTKTTTEPDGTIVETTTTTITEKYSDGSTGVKTKVETVKKQGPGGSGGAKAPSTATPAESEAPKVENTTNPTFIQESLEEHNILRAKHKASPLVLNADLGKISQAWANNLAKLGKMQHSTCGFGENVYWSTDIVDGRRPVDQWYSEIKDYDFKKLEGQPGTGHFTQVIWKGTSEMGVAMAKGKNGYYVVANYTPPGNFVGRYPENIQNL